MRIPVSLLLSSALLAAHYSGTVSASCSGLQGDVVFVLDGSGSVTSANFQIVKQFVQDLVTDFDVSLDLVRVAALTYGSGVTTNFHLDAHATVSDVNSAVASIAYPGGATYTNLALDAVRADYSSGANGDRAGVPDVAIVITDGLSTDPGATVTAADNAKAAGFVLFAIGIGTGVTELNAIASDPDSDRVFTVADFNGLASIKSTFQAKVCTSDNFNVVAAILAVVSSSWTLGPGAIAGIVVGAAALLLAAASAAVAVCLKNPDACKGPLAFLPLSCLLRFAKKADGKIGPMSNASEPNVETGPEGSASQPPEGEAHPVPTPFPGDGPIQVRPMDTRFPARLPPLRR